MFKSHTADLNDPGVFRDCSGDFLPEFSGLFFREQVLELRERVMSWRTYPVSTKDWRPTAFFMASMNSGACSGGRPATAFS